MKLPPRKRGRPPSEFRMIVEEVKALLKQPDLSPAERLKALEVWTRVLMTQHRVDDGDKQDASFFTK